jgi:tryptophanyl-tRNA synthetase
MNAFLGELQRCTPLKTKYANNPDNVNAGLLTYPTLMAADIIVHKAQKFLLVRPEHHLEMTRLLPHA